MSKFVEYSHLFRLPGLGGLSLVPVFGALSLTGTGVSIDLETIFLLFLVGVLTSIYGFVLNDYVDVEVDRLSMDSEKRPLVTGAISKKTALLISVLCVVFWFSIIFVFFYKQEMSFFYGLICMILATFFGTVYNVFGKKIFGSDIFVGLSEGLLVLFAAFMVSDGVILSVFTWVIFILVFNQFFFMNAIVGGIKDVDHDYKKGVKNIAFRSGVRVTNDRRIVIPFSFKFLGLSIRFFDGLLVFVPFVFYKVDYYVWHLILLAFFAVVILFLTFKLLNIKTFESIEESIKIFGVQGVLRQCLVPVLLVSVIGVFYSVVLIVFPLIWYGFFTLVSRKKIGKHVM